MIKILKVQSKILKKNKCIKKNGLIKSILNHSPQEPKDLPSPHKFTGGITGPRKRSVTGGTST